MIIVKRRNANNLYTDVIINECFHKLKGVIFYVHHYNIGARLEILTEFLYIFFQYAITYNGYITFVRNKISKTLLEVIVVHRQQ